MIKRFHRLDVATSDLNDAASTYERNFGFRVTRSPGSDIATLSIGGAEIRLVCGALAADALKAGGEGLLALWLEAEDLDQVIALLRKAGLPAGTRSHDHGRRILALEPEITNRVSLFIFDRKG